VISDQSTEIGAEMSPTDFENLAHGNNAFALDLYHELGKSDGNLFFSPYSISVALAMTYAGARGETEFQMKRALHFGLPNEKLHAAFFDLQKYLGEAETSEGVQLKIANSLWPQAGYTFLSDFIALIRTNYGVTITPVDFAGDTEGARQVINQWVDEKTERKIPELIPQGRLTALTRLVLTNAIYFKGMWAAPFKQELTKEADFWSVNGQVKVPMMTRHGKYRYAGNKDLQALELSYLGNGLSMLLILPREKDGLANLEGGLTPDFISKLTQKMWETDLTVFLPKFKMESAFLLNEMLAALGMTDAFRSDKADFSGMNGTKELLISLVIHKAFIEINEEGTEAAAATAVVTRAKGFIEPIEFRADHPFVFIIRENQTGSILFMGRMLQP
jgi:serpin B